MKTVRITLSELWNSEYPYYIRYQLEIIGKHNLTGPIFATRLAKLTSFEPQLAQIIVQDRANKNSAPMSNEDVTRDTLFKCGYGLAKNFAQLPLPEFSTPGAILVALYKKHGLDLVDDSYMSETQRLYNFCSDAEANVEAKNAFATLGLTPILTALKESNARFDNYYKQRNTETAALPSVNVRGIRSECNKAMTAVWEAIDFAASEPDGAQYDALIAEINTANERIRTQLKARAARRKAGETVENEPPIEVK